MEKEENKKKIIENVCSIGWGETSANPYVGAMIACMDALHISTDDDIIKRIFYALGYNVSIYCDSDTHHSLKKRSKEFYRNLMISSITL